MVYVVTAGCTGTLGALIFLQKLRLSPEAGFSVNDWTVVVIFMVVIGGIGTLEGPIIGMLIYFGLRRASCRLRQLVSDPIRYRRDRDHAESARRSLGPHRQALQPSPLLGPPSPDAVAAAGVAVGAAATAPTSKLDGTVH